ncbi:MAG: RNA polymerase subunit sigma [Planctomycetes bacterium]|nr:RNA polymerase subunit sigma [Planctomycetota bacterium]
MDGAPDNLTHLLQAARGGDRQAEADVLRAVYAELRQIAESWMSRTPPGQTLQPTALVHEAFVRLVGRDNAGWENRAHFFFTAGRAMRDILVERARARGALKRGGGRRRVDLDQLIVATEAPDAELLALDEALTRFESRYPWEHRIVMLRFFAGLTHEETAQAMAAPLRTIERDWRFARAWLRDALSLDDDEHTE